MARKIKGIKTSSEGSQSVVRRELRPLTVAQSNVFAQIKLLITKLGYSPSLEEIREACGFASLSTVHSYIEIFERKGYLVRDPGKNRSIQLTEEVAI